MIFTSSGGSGEYSFNIYIKTLIKIMQRTMEEYYLGLNGSSAKLPGLKGRNKTNIGVL